MNINGEDGTPIDIVTSSETDWQDKFAAMKEITEEAKIIEILEISEDPEIRLIALRATDNQNIFIKVALNDPDPTIRKIALERMKTIHHEEFIQILNTDKNWIVRVQSINKLPQRYQDIFIQVVINDSHFKVRKAAREKIRMNELSEEHLTLLANTAWDFIVRRACIRHIKTEFNLLNVALNCGDYRISEETIELIQNEDLLKQIAINADFAHNRVNALRRITDQDFLYSLAISDTSQFVVETCISMIYQNQLLSGLRLTAPQKYQKLIRERINQLEKNS